MPEHLLCLYIPGSIPARDELLFESFFEIEKGGGGGGTVEVYF
jgi:hypothetical protein